ncbi:MauE/DoxX family redox-associated membrane protein [Pedobacter sp. Leaf194]|uniref:MauE/DoxX family redox-associated membrane protein n=1 Tax=Pedobacter sp. Leaf194 TaxID=1736297 RepID=UPI000702D567|nr:MauE/DoxX family redox-associated membrane protein [Pedobacter sp. Leaf194]KQS36850.1 hypothetical protein ASG14_07380 [Pedobacter sp. Leaf194]
MESTNIKNDHAGYLLKLGIYALIILWVYTAGSKVLDLTDFRRQLSLQPFGTSINSALVILLPTLEILAGLLLAIERTKGLGLWLSAALLTAFTAYVFLVLIGHFAKMPCSCGGILAFLSWRSHLIFNMVFLGINLIALYKINIKKGGNGA